MTSDQERRFSLLQTEWCDERFIHELYGIELGKEPKFLKHFQTWVEQRKAVAVRTDGAIHRYRFETFLQTLKLLTKKWGSLCLGMTVASLEELLKKLNATGLVFAYYPSTDPTAFVGEKIDHDILELFEEFRFRTFSDHNDFCRRLHQAIEEKYKLRVEAEFDTTCKYLFTDKNRWDYAHDWDAITLEPVSLQYQVWLDLGKPMNLRPDCVSAVFYVQEMERLKGYVAGTGDPEIPPERSRMDQWTAP